MPYLLDTNILLRLANEQDPKRALTEGALTTLATAREPVYITPQVCIEFWNVATRPVGSNGLGFSLQVTAVLLNRFLNLFPLLPDADIMFPHWLNIVTTCRCSGRQVHDARLVAVMLTHNIPHILTFDIDDFQRYHSLGISSVHPSAV